MITYKDIITGDEMISDSYDLKEIDGVVLEADCAMVAIGGMDTEANAEPGEDLADGIVHVNNIVNAFHLQSTAFDKKSYMSYLKSWMKNVVSKLEARGESEDAIIEFQRGAQAYAKKIFGNFRDYDFYTGESGGTDGMVALLNYREDGATPFFTFWKHGLETTKA